MAWSSSVAIEELDQDRSVLRVLTLLGPAAPHRGARWAGENDLATTWYQGNPDEATQTTTNVKDMPSEWEGTWRLTMLNRRPSRYVESQQGGAATTVTAPGFLVDVFDDLRRRGRRLRVTWATDSDDPQIARTVVREGRIKSFEAAYETSVDVAWKVAFHWQSRGGSQQRVAATRDSQTTGATSALQSAMQGTQQAVQALIAAQNNPTQFDLGQLEKIAEAPLQLLGSVLTPIEDGAFALQKIAGIVTQFKNLPFDLAAQTLGAATDTLAACTTFFDSLSRTPAEQGVLGDEADVLVSTWAGLGAAIDSVGATSRQAQSVQAAMKQTLAAANSRQGQQTAQALAATRPGGIRAIRVVRAGDTPASLSNLYYGTPDHDIDILRANDLPWYQVLLTPGQPVVIPAVNPQQAP